MPDDYYVSQYSGEEIDERLTAAHNAVRYDAAQSLTDAQKTQARGNIDAAPGGFGWGDSAQYTFETNEEFKAWFMQNAAPKCSRNTFAASVFITDIYNHRLLIIASGNNLTSGIVILGYTYDGYELRATIDDYGNWGHWEWVNPPMQLGVEYRTTERHSGKPVYAKLVDCGVMADNKNVSILAESYRAIDVILKVSPMLVPMVPSGSILNGWQGGFYCDGLSITLYAGQDLAGANLNAIALVKFISA